jgi:taurine dioxygenase
MSDSSVSSGRGVDAGDVTITPLSSVLGVEVTGVDVRDLNERTLLQVRDALLRYGVLVVRDQEVAPADQLAFVDRLYPLSPPTKISDLTVPDHPQIVILSNIIENGQPVGVSDAGLLWHSDGCFRSNPELFVCLHAIEVPMGEGQSLGATRYANVQAAYDALPQIEQRQLEGLVAIQSYAHSIKRLRELGLLTRKAATDDAMAEVQDFAQPVVRVHPITGRRGLFVNDSFTSHIEGMSAAGSRALLGRLRDHLSRPEFVFTHTWRPNDLVVWDNVATQHRGTFDYGDLRRRMHRCYTTGPQVESSDGSLHMSASR